MKYCKPEITLLGQARHLIASSLLKGQFPTDASGDPSNMTPTPAYQADED